MEQLPSLSVKSRRPVRRRQLAGDSAMSLALTQPSASTPLNCCSSTSSCVPSHLPVTARQRRLGARPASARACASVQTSRERRLGSGCLEAAAEASKLSAKASRAGSPVRSTLPVHCKLSSLSCVRRALLSITGGLAPPPIDRRATGLSALASSREKPSTCGLKREAGAKVAADAHSFLKSQSEQCRLVSSSAHRDVLHRAR